jgi:hypothetical protein
VRFVSKSGDTTPCKVTPVIIPQLYPQTRVG